MQLDRKIRVAVVGGHGPLRREVEFGLGRIGVERNQQDPDAFLLLQGTALETEISQLRKRHAGPIVFIADSGDESLAVRAFRAGVADYLVWPAPDTDLLGSLERSRARPSVGHSVPCIGSSRAMETIRQTVKRLAVTPCSVLLSGETGAGKEVIAQLLHRWSDRSEAPLLNINCAALPEALLESELFGYERGAFTGAASRFEGRLHSAGRGTVFLDEIGELPLSAQAKLLRAIEYKEVQVLGAAAPRKLDVRWVAATNRDLADLSRKGLFRADLYYRLSVAHVRIPALRERREDIEPLALHFLDMLAREYGRRLELTPPAMQCLQAYDWPGNARELRNVLEQCVIHAPSAQIETADLPLEIRASAHDPEPAGVERAQLLAALRAASGNKSEAAKSLRLSRMTLYRKLASHGIDSDNPCYTEVSHA